MPTEKHRTPLIAELLGGGALIALLSATLIYGGLMRSVEDHVDPEKHQGIVLAGNIETERKITAIETNVGNIQQSVEENKDVAKEIQSEVGEIKGDIRVILELQRQQIELDRARRAAAGGSP